jgi:hypothetical protein
VERRRAVERGCAGVCCANEHCAKLFALQKHHHRTLLPPTPAAAPSVLCTSARGSRLALAARPSLATSRVPSFRSAQKKMAESGYSFSLTTFSPSGKLLQLEHALKAVQQGKTSLGIQGASGGVHQPTRSPPKAIARAHSPHCSLSARTRPPPPPARAATNGVVLATEKKLPSILVEESSVEKIQHFTGNVGAWLCRARAFDENTPFRRCGVAAGQGVRPAVSSRRAAGVHAEEPAGRRRADGRGPRFGENAARKSREGGTTSGLMAPLRSRNTTPLSPPVLQASSTRAWAPTSA